ncbi:MAG: hypothetical protein QNJ97_16430 [Myxococcota bacterium]|nr:hypothetical protein [Myxococcota bacterium]
MNDKDKLVELTRVADPVEADLLAAFLEADGLEFQMRRSARTMAPAFPTAQSATIFMVYEADVTRAQALLEEYSRAQAATTPPDSIDSDETDA